MIAMVRGHPRNRLQRRRDCIGLIEVKPDPVRRLGFIRCLAFAKTNGHGSKMGVIPPRFPRY